MTSEQRLDRLERIAMMLVRAGVRARSDMNEKINMLIDSQVKTDDRFAKFVERCAKYDALLAMYNERFAKNDERFARNDERIKEIGERADQTLSVLRNLMQDRQNGPSEL